MGFESLCAALIAIVLGLVVTQGLAALAQKFGDHNLEAGIGELLSPLVQQSGGGPVILAHVDQMTGHALE